MRELKILYAWILGMGSALFAVGIPEILKDVEIGLQVIAALFSVLISFEMYWKIRKK